MKENDIVMIFGNPVENKYPIDQAKLVRKISDKSDKLEAWYVEYLNDTGKEYVALIKKDGTK